MNIFRKALGVSCVLFTATIASGTATAQTHDAPKKAEPARAEVPDGSPSLPRDTAINQSTAETLARGRDATRTEGDDAPIASSEERIESRLAVIRTGRATVTDPNVGRYDRAASNTGKRVAPTLWELFRF
jgi:hypothetical protein